MSDNVILVPRRADNGWRDELWKFTRARWEQLNFPIFEGDHLTGPFNRSAAINNAAKLAGDWDTALIVDGDVLIDLTRVQHGVAYANRMGRIVFPFRARHHLNNGMTRAIMGGFEGNWTKGIITSFKDNKSSCLAVPRAVWDKVGGFDERFVGWGWEDVAFAHATTVAVGNFLRIQGDLWHLFHHQSPENNHQSPLYLANRDLCQRYRERNHSWALTKELLSEPGGPLS